MKKSVHADIRDFVNAGFMTFGIDKDLSEDQIPHLCERFETRSASCESMLTDIKHLVLEGGGTRCTWLHGLLDPLVES